MPISTAIGRMLERSLELSSKELADAHEEAMQARRRLTDALEN